MSSPTDATASIYNRRFWIAYAANMVLVTTNAVTFRFADFVAHLGGSETVTGDLASFGVIGALVFRLFAGGWMDRFGIGRVWVVGSIALVTGNLMMLTADDLGWWMYAARLLFKAGLATLFGCSMAHIQNEAPPSHRTEVIASLGSSGFLGLMIGTALADGIFRLIPGESDTTFRVLFGVSTLTSGAYLLLVTVLTRRDVRPGSMAKTPPVWTLFREHFPGPVVLCAFFMGGGFAVSSTFLTRFADARGFSGISAFFITYALSAFVFRVVSRTWSRKIGRHALILIGMTAQAIGFAAVPLVHVEWVLALPALVTGFGHALLFPAVISLGTETYPIKYRGTGTTLVLGFFDLGELLLMPLLGRLIDAYGFEPMFYVTSAVALVVAAGYGLSTRGQVDTDGQPTLAAAET